MSDGVQGPPLEIVFLFHSTPPMNIITYNSVYSLYSKATFEERRGLIVTQSQSRPGSAKRSGLFETTEASSSIPTLEHSFYTVNHSRPDANTVDFDVHVLSLGDFRYTFSAATHLGRVIQSPEMTRSLQWATGCSWDDIYKVVAPQFLARQSVERFQSAIRTYEWFENAGTKLRLMAEVLAMLARRSGGRSVRA